LFSTVRGGDCVPSGRLVNSNRGRRFSAKLDVAGVVARRELNPGDVAHSSDLSARASLHDDSAELFFVGEAALRADGVLKCGRAFRYWRRTDYSRCDLHILLLDCGHDVLRGQIAGCDLVWIKPEAH